MVCEVVCVLGLTVGGMLSAEVVPAAGWCVVGFSGGVLVLWGACGICCLGWVVLGALLVLVWACWCRRLCGRFGCRCSICFRGGNGGWFGYGGE